MVDKNNNPAIAPDPFANQPLISVKDFEVYYAFDNDDYNL